MSIATRPQLSHLRALESEAIHVMREVAAEFEPFYDAYLPGIALAQAKARVVPLRPSAPTT